MVTLEITVPNTANKIMLPKFLAKYLIFVVKADSKIIGGSKAIKNI